MLARKIILHALRVENANNQNNYSKLLVDENGEHTELDRWNASTIWQAGAWFYQITDSQHSLGKFLIS